MAAVSKTAKPSAPVVDGLFRSTKTGILPLGFKVLMNHSSFCLFVRRGICSTLKSRSVERHKLEMLFGRTRMQLCRHRFSSAPRDEAILSSRWEYPQCRGLKETW